MSALAELMASIVESVKATLQPDGTRGVDVKPLHCPMELAELSRHFTAVPSVVVTMPEIKTGRPEGGVVVADVAVAIYILTAGINPLVRNDAALAIVEALLRVATSSRWGAPGVRPASDASARVIFADELDRKAAAIWELSFELQVDLPPAAGLNITPFDGASVELEPVTGVDLGALGIA